MMNNKISYPRYAVQYSLLLLSLISSTAFANNSVVSQCASDETVIFSCSSSQKVISLCASKNLSATEGYLQYRFGPLSAPEFIYPKQKNNPRNYFQARSQSFSGGGGAYISFTQSAYRYIIFTAIGKGWGNPEGVAVEKNGKLISS